MGGTGRIRAMGQTMKLKRIGDAREFNVEILARDGDVVRASIDGVEFTFVARDLIKSIHSLWGDPEFTHYLVYAPEKQYVDSTCTQRIYTEMHTGTWWWDKQVRAMVVRR